MFDIAVVIPTVLRPHLVRSIRSVANQTVDAHINIIVGVDYALGDTRILDEIRQYQSPNRTITIISLGYSTSKARGGMYPNRYGGAIRTICSYAANAPYVAYLDDDNWYAPNHLESLLQAIQGKQWAFSLRQFVDEDTLRPLGVDRWESVGPGRGVYDERFGGFCDTSSLMLDVAQNVDLFPLWSMSPFADGSGEDRMVFEHLKNRSYGETNLPTSYYMMHHTDGMHSARLAHLRGTGVTCTQPIELDEFCRQMQPNWPPSDGFTPKAADLQGWGGSNSPAIASTLRELQPKTVVEVGSWKGASAVFMCKTLLEQGIEPKILCVDTWLGGVDHWQQATLRDAMQIRFGYPELCQQFVSNILHEGLEKFIVPLPTTSRNAAKLLRGSKVLVDFIYIDAGHDEDDVLEDLRAYWPVLRRGGVMMGDDYKPHVWPGVVRAVERFATDVGAQIVVCGDTEYPQFLIRKDW